MSHKLLGAAMTTLLLVGLSFSRKNPPDNVRLFRVILFATGVLLLMGAFAVTMVHAEEAIALSTGIVNGRMYAPSFLITPGLADPALTKEVICSPSFRTGPHRNVTQKMHRQVWAAYGMDWDKDHSCCEDDHLISIELGGSNDNRNRWPQPWAEARLKDQVENYLHKEVCSDTITLDEAQKEISGDWRAVYEHMQHSDHAGSARLR